MRPTGTSDHSPLSARVGTISHQKDLFVGSLGQPAFGGCKPQAGKGHPSPVGAKSPQLCLVSIPPTAAGRQAHGAA